MYQGCLVADSFTASQLTDIAHNCHCFGLLTGVHLEYVSMIRPQSISPEVPEVMVIRARGRRSVYLAEV